MKTRILFVLLALIPEISMAATARPTGGANARVGMQRVGGTGVRKSTAAGTAVTKKTVAVPATVADVAEYEEENAEQVTVSDAVAGDCREEFRACMDEFCLLDESEGYRCACSSNIEASKSLIKEIQSIQEEADKLFTEGVERENLGAKADFVFGTSDAAKKSSRASGISFTEWLNADVESDGDLAADEYIGDALYEMAYEMCAPKLDACPDKAEMEELLYSRQVVADCKAFSSYLADQKTNVLANKRTAESAVRQARLANIDTTNKYNRGECLLAYRGCIADKGGCGTEFENCLDSELLARRAHACDDVLDQCMAVKDEVLNDWQAESVSILAEAAKYADKYRRQTCRAQTMLCLENGCSVSVDSDSATASACLTNINVATGICPIIQECDELVPGFKNGIKDDLASLRLRFCQNDVDACLREKCGQNFTAPECLGKQPREIAELCPQGMFPSCKNEKQFDIIVSAIMLQMDYQLMQGCINYFSDLLGRSCGTDMACLPSDATVAAMTEIPETEEMIDFRATVRQNARDEVDKFFKQFENDRTVAQCASAQMPAGARAQVGENVFTSAKIIANIGAEQRAMRELDLKIAELSRQQDVEQAEKNCYEKNPVEKPDASKKEGDQNYSYVRSVHFEPSLRNCRICKVQRVCEVGGESKAAAGLKAAAGGLAAGASAGTMVSPGWGTAIGGVIGAVGAGLGAGLSAGEKEFCQELEVCEDVNY